MKQEDIASRLVARVVHSGHVRDASFLYALAKQEYQRLRDTCLPQLPDFEARDPVDGSAAVELCLSVRTGAQAQHVDRGLFNLVTGEPAAMQCLRLPGLVSAKTLDLRMNQGAAVLIPGMTSALLLSKTGDVSMPPMHSADIPPGQQLTVIAVKLKVDLPIRALCWTSLQQALTACFAHGPNPQLTASSMQVFVPKSEPVAPAGGPFPVSIPMTQAPTDSPSSPTITCSTPDMGSTPDSSGGSDTDTSALDSDNAKWQLSILTATGWLNRINHLNGMSTIQELYVAASELDCTAITTLELYHKGRYLNRHISAGITLQSAGVSNDDMIQMIDKRSSKFQFFIRDLEGKTLALQAEPTTTISDLKAAVRARTTVATENMRLLYQLMQLDDGDRTLQSYGVERGSTLHLLLRLKGD